MQGRLSALQRDVLREFSRLAPDFFLTGGAALAGFHLGHRVTEDLVDVEALEQAGHAVEEALPLAARKDTGFSAAQLAWVLHDLPIAPDARGLAGRPAAELVAYRDALRKRLQRLARPT